MANLPPRLIAIADGPLWLEPARRAQLAFAVGRLAAACSGRSWQAGVLLRHHGWSAAQWIDSLEGLQWLGEFGLVLGISAPAGATHPEHCRKLAQLGVAWAQVPELLASTWDSALPPGDERRLVAHARSCHGLAGAAAALAAGAHWAMLSPVLQTPSKPDTAALGWPALAAAAALFPQRIVALGGLDATTAGQALRCGAAGVAVLRAWQDQPQALADALSDAATTDRPY